MAGKRQAKMRLMDAILEASDGEGPPNIAEWCRRHEIEPRTFYRHRERVRAQGSWAPRSRRPHSSPGATPPTVIAAVRELRAKLAPDHGADSIRDGLCVRAGEQDWAGQGLVVPSRATINRILDREGLLAKNPAKRPKSSYRRFVYARPRDCYQIDATVHSLAGGHAVAFDVIDDHSRVWVASYVAAGETITAAIAAMDAAVEQWGPPGLVLADNGSAFAHPRRGRDKTRLGVFAATLRERWGTVVIHSSPYHPQTLGKNERLHQTAKKLLAHRWPDDPPADTAALAARLDQVREFYNQQRRHSAIARAGIRTPAQAWATAPAHGGPGDLPRQHDATVARRKVASNGAVTLAGTNRGPGHTFSLGRPLAGATVTVLRDGDHITVYTAEGEVLGHRQLDLTKRYQGPLTPAAA